MRFIVGGCRNQEHPRQKDVFVTFSNISHFQLVIFEDIAWCVPDGDGVLGQEAVPGDGGEGGQCHHDQQERGDHHESSTWFGE